MPRPKANPSQQLRAYELHRIGLGPKAILDRLAVEFLEPVSARTIASWVKDFKSLSQERVDLDAQFEWHRSEEFGIPWEASAYLLNMWKDVLRYQTSTPTDFDVTPPPTVRQVRWWWRVHLAAPDIDSIDTFHLADRFVSREMLHDVLGEPLVLDDLEAHLAFKPWTGEDSRHVYHVDIDRGLIKPLRGEMPFRIPPEVRSTLNTDALRTIDKMGETIGIGYESELLYSQCKEEFFRNIKLETTEETDAP